MKNVEAKGRDLIGLLVDFIKENPHPEKIYLVWQEQEEGIAPDMGLVVAIQAAAQDGEIGDLTQNINLALEGGDGSPNTIGWQVYDIPGGLGVVIAARRREISERKPPVLSPEELADDLKERLEHAGLIDEECEVKCHVSRNKLYALRNRKPGSPMPTLAI